MTCVTIGDIDTEIKLDAKTLKKLMAMAASELPDDELAGFIGEGDEVVYNTIAFTWLFVSSPTVTD
jgi:hypothetical protein